MSSGFLSFHQRHTVGLSLLLPGLLLISLIGACTTKPDNNPPTALFTVSPESGGLETLFEFDASGSTDPEEENRFLQVRWDWNGDEEWDTLWGTQKKRTHTFGTCGIHTVQLEVRDSWKVTASASTEVSVGAQPIASFMVTPAVGTTDTTFTFDASASSNPGNPSSPLEFRWDFESDGTWDADWASMSVMGHQFVDDGDYQVLLEIRNDEAVTDTTSRAVHVYPADSWPTAFFTVSPDTGSYSEIFTFDASGSTDPQDPVSALQVRWDWENDGTWDTQLSTIKSASHQFSLSGIYTVVLEVVDTDGFLNTTSKDIVATNTAPTASYIVSPSSGDMMTEYFFDASGSSDPDQDTTSLSIRWDWENDGIWDTQWSTSKTASHYYFSAGMFMVLLEVRDNEGLTDTAQELVSVAETQLGPFLWRFRTNNSNYTTPAIATDGTIYFGSYDNHLYALNGDGTQKWAYEIRTNTSSSPAVSDDGTIYIGDDYGWLYAISSGGNLVWEVKLGNELKASPSIGRDGNIYAGTLSSGLKAVSQIGLEVWTAPTGTILSSSAAVGPDSTIYVGSLDGALYAIRSSGSQKWKYQTGNQIYSSPAIDTDGTIYFGSTDHNLYALNTDGTLKWSYDTGVPIHSSPAIGTDGTIYIGSGSSLVALYSNGILRWQYATGGVVYSSPAVGDDEVIYFGSYDGYLYAIDALGSLLQKYYAGGIVDPGPSIGADGTLYFCSADEHIYSLATRSGGLASSPWPKFGRDRRNTGRK